MNVRKRFMRIAEKMRVDFEDTKEGLHKLGRGTNREEILKSYLESVLPSKFGLGKGEVVTSDNYHSREMDIIIYDKERCPKLIVEDGHALFPIETVYGVIQVKSSLSSPELKSAYENIKSLKDIIPKQSFTVSNGMGMQSTMQFPHLVGVIVAFEATRGLETIAEQCMILDEELQNISLRPDFVVAIDNGIVGPSECLRGDFNRMNSHLDDDSLYKVRNTKRHTLLRFYMQLLDELNKIILPPLDLEKYLKMPEVLDKFRVTGHDRFLFEPVKGNAAKHKIRKINKLGVEKIVAHCRKQGPKLQSEILKEWLGSLPMGTSEDDWEFEVYEFNPRNLPYLDPRKVDMVNGRPVSSEDCFHGVSITIDGKAYSVDLMALDDEDFDEQTDFDIDEFFYS